MICHVYFQAVVRPSGGYAVALKWSMYNVYGMKPDDVSRGRMLEFESGGLRRGGNYGGYNLFRYALLAIFISPDS